MSGEIPRDFIRQLVDGADIADIIGGRVKLTQRGTNLFGLCPFHSEKTPSFSVNPNKGFYHCFGCGASGDVLSFLVQQNGGDFIAGVENLAEILGVRIPKTGGAKHDNTVNNRQVLRLAMEHWKKRLKNTPAAVEYLKQRGVSGETAKRYELGYAANDWHDLTEALTATGTDKVQLITAGVVREKDERLYDYFRHRIIFPIIEANNHVCGFGGRVLRADDEPKYLNSSETAHFSKRRMLYGLPQATEVVRDKNRLLICEGYMDVVMLAENGFGEAVATMGTAATPEQMKKAVRMSSNIVFAFDSDAAGKKGALRALNGILPALKDGVSIRFLFMPEGEDPDSYVRKFGAAAFEQRIEKAMPLADYLVDSLWAESSAADDDGTRTMVLREGERLMRLINTEQAPYWQQLLTERLAAKSAVKAQTIQQAVSRPVRRQGKHSSKRMPPTDKLFLLLCCLSVEPNLIRRLERENVPLLGGQEDTEIINGVLSKLRWNMDDEPPDVPTILQGEGYPVLAKQVRDTVRRRFVASTDIEAEIETLIGQLHRAHQRITGAGKKQWLEKLEAGAIKQPPKLPEGESSD